MTAAHLDAEKAWGGARRSTREGLPQLATRAEGQMAQHGTRDAITAMLRVRRRRREAHVLVERLLGEAAR
jgi:hypothetical protein